MYLIYFSSLFKQMLGVVHSSADVFDVYLKRVGETLFIIIMFSSVFFFLGMITVQLQVCENRMMTKGESSFPSC